jgi:hypothetical protein
LAANSERASRALQQLRRTASQRAAAAGPAISDARADCDELSANGEAATALKFVWIVE